MEQNGSMHCDYSMPCEAQKLRSLCYKFRSSFVWVSVFLTPKPFRTEWGCLQMCIVFVCYLVGYRSRFCVALSLPGCTTGRCCCTFTSTDRGRIFTATVLPSGTPRRKTTKVGGPRRLFRALLSAKFPVSRNLQPARSCI